MAIKSVLVSSWGFQTKLEIRSYYVQPLTELQDLIWFLFRYQYMLVNLLVNIYDKLVII